MERHVFAKGLSFWKLFCFFIIGCLFGTFFEEILYFVQHGSYSRRSGVLYGPFSPLYGFGVFLILIFLGRRNLQRGLFKTFLLSSILGGVTEYIASFLVECFFQIRFWDYSEMFLNVHGRTTIPFMAAWGLFATLLLKVIYPFLSKFIEKIPPKSGYVLCVFLLLFLLSDIGLTFASFLRMRDRNQGNLPHTVVENFLDRTYPNDFMYQKFPLLEGKV